MAYRKIDEFESDPEELRTNEFDVADQAFWDEFWTQEKSNVQSEPLFTITIRNQVTGEERVVENVRLKFQNSKKLKA